jgi:Zn-dependent protease with chaperone function
MWKWLDLIRTEYTLYHEVGHHSHRHTFGKDVGQENEADDYAKQLMHQAHTNLKRIVKLLGFLGLKKKNNS